MLFRRMSIRLTSEMISAGAIEEEDREVYQYTLEVFAAMIVSILSSVILFTVFGRLKEGLLFLVVFFPLRTYSGGYHASSHLKCYLLSMAIMLLVVFCLRIIPNSAYFATSAPLVLLSSVTIILLAPVEDRNRPLDEEEKVVYRRKSLKVLAVVILAFLLLLILRMGLVCLIISMALAVTAISMIIAKLSYAISVRKGR